MNNFYQQKKKYYNTDGWGGSPISEEYYEDNGSPDGYGGAPNKNLKFGYFNDSEDGE